MRALRLLSLACLGIVGGCGYVMTATPLQGSRVDISALVGRWDGEYWSDESRRQGTLQFMIRPGADTLYGDVVMTTVSRARVIAADANDPMHIRHAGAPELLRITFAAVRGALIEGELEPYVAPDCACVVTTEFIGRLSGDVVEGTYLTRGSIGHQNGRWIMRRVARSE